MVTDAMVQAAAKVLNTRLTKQDGLAGVSRDMLEAALSVASANDGPEDEATWTAFSKANAATYAKAESELFSHLDQVVARERKICAASGRHPHDGCSCTDVELLDRAALSVAPKAEPVAWQVRAMQRRSTWCDWYTTGETEVIAEIVAFGKRTYEDGYVVEAEARPLYAIPPDTASTIAELRERVKALEAAIEYGDDAIIAWYGSNGTEWRRKDNQSPSNMTTPVEYRPITNNKPQREANHEPG